MSKTETVSYEDVVADLNRAIQRLYKAKAVETKQELVNNVYPLMLSFVEASNARHLESEEMIAELLGETESIVQPELYDEIADAFNAGRALVDALATVTTDEVTAKRLAALALTFVEKSNAVEQLLVDMTLEDEPDDGSDPDDGESAPVADADDAEGVA